MFSLNSHGLCDGNICAEWWKQALWVWPGLRLTIDCTVGNSSIAHYWYIYRFSISLFFPSGLPHFSVEPHHLSVVANVGLSLHCEAHGPPEPVRVIWLQDGAPLNNLDDPISLSPSTLHLSGIYLSWINCILLFTTWLSKQQIPCRCLAETLCSYISSFFYNQCLLITLDVCLWVLQIFNQWNADKTLKLHLCFEWRATDSLSSFCTNNARVNTELVKHFLYTNTVHIKAKCSCIWEAETSVFG